MRTEELDPRTPHLRPGAAKQIKKKRPCFKKRTLGDLVVGGDISGKEAAESCRTLRVPVLLSQDLAWDEVQS